MEILTRALKEEHRRAGMYLEEDDHFLRLMKGQKVLARFSATGVKFENVLAEADKHLEEEVDNATN